MASQNPSERPPYPPQGYAPSSSTALPSHLQNLSIAAAGAPTQPWLAAGARPSLTRVQSAQNRPTGPPTFIPNAPTSASAPIPNAGPAMARLMNPPPTAALTAASANGPHQMVASGLSHTHFLSHQQAITSATPPTPTTGAPFQSNAPPLHTGRGATSMPPVGPFTAPVQPSVMNAPSLYSSSTPNVQASWRTPQPQTSVPGAYPGAVLPTLASTGMFQAVPTTWATSQPPYPGLHPCALLYTTMDGQRRIRVTTLSLPCSVVLSNVFGGADLDAQFTYFLKHAAQEIPTNPLPQLREKINSCVNILFTYRKFCATASSAGQLVLPEALKLLPLYMLALTKSIGLRSDARTDDRCHWLARVLTISCSLAIPTVYPRMFSIHDLMQKELKNATMPSPLHLSSENLGSEGVFLLETGEDAFIFAGKGVSSETLFQLFGIHSVNEMQANQFVLQEFDNDASRKLNALVNEIRKERCSYLRFWWCRRGDLSEFLFFSLLVEDKNALGLSYVEFLIRIHRQIQNKMI